MKNIVDCKIAWIRAACCLFISVLIFQDSFSQSTGHKNLKLVETFDSKESLYEKYDSLEDESRIINPNNTSTSARFSTSGVNFQQLPEKINTVILSPNNKYYVAYEEKENETSHIYFFSSAGKLLNTVEVNIYPNIKYSQNSEYVEVFNRFGRQYMIYTNEGILIQEGDYIDLTQDNQAILHNIFISNDGSSLLISISNKAYLFSSNKIKQWERSSSPIIDCQFLDENIINLKLISRQREKANPFNLEVLSKPSGQTLDSINQVSDVIFINSKVIVGKNSRFYEYEIQP